MWIFIKKLFQRSKPAKLVHFPQAMSLEGVQAVLVFAPHPDDEVIGCGGLLALLSKQGVYVKVILVTDGSGGGGLPPGADLIRQSEFQKAIQILGVSNHESWLEPDGDVRSHAGLTQRVMSVCQERSWDWILIPNEYDYHRDHQVIASTVSDIHRQLLHASKLWAYEVWSPVQASHILDITEVYERKMRALHEHATALSCADYVQATEGLNHFRGIYLGKGRKAEAYALIEK